MPSTVTAPASPSIGPLSRTSVCRGCMHLSSWDSLALGGSWHCHFQVGLGNKITQPLKPLTAASDTGPRCLSLFLEGMELSGTLAVTRAYSFLLGTLYDGLSFSLGCILSVSAFLLRLAACPAVAATVTSALCCSICFSLSPFCLGAYYLLSEYLTFTASPGWVAGGCLVSGPGQLPHSLLLLL